MFAPSRLAVALLACFTLSQTGCISLYSLLGRPESPILDTTMLETQGYSVPAGGLPVPVGPAMDSRPRVVMEIRADGKHIESIPLPTDRSMFIEDLVQEAQLHEHFGRLDISIMRPNGSGNPPVRLDVHTDDKGRADNAGHNYALLPNDHIIIINDQRSALEKFIDKNFRR